MLRLALLLPFALFLAGCDSNEPIVQSCANESRVIEEEEITTGTSPARVGAQDFVSLRYTGVLEDGTVFLDESRALVDMLALPSGLQEGVLNMRLGSRKRITVPPYRGYGTRVFANTVDGESVTIPSCSTLVYDVTVLDIQS